MSNSLRYFVPLQSVKDNKYTQDEEVDILLNYLPPRSDWQPEILINKLGGLAILCQHITLSPTWENYQGKYVLATLALCLSFTHTLIYAPCTKGENERKVFLKMTKSGNTGVSRRIHQAPRLCVPAPHELMDFQQQYTKR